MRVQPHKLVTVLCLLWAFTWLVITRHAMLDDSLIHLRYAVNLVHFHAVTFDGVHRTFGTSSPLYLSILAGAYSLWPSVFVPKVVSVVFYGALLCVVGYLILRLPNHPLVRSLLVLLLTSIASVMGVRWLADGMESGLVCLSAICLALLASRTAQRPQQFTHALLYFSAGFCLTLLRLELLSLCGVCALILLLSQWQRDRHKWTQALFAASPIVLGGAAAMLCVHLVFGSFLPDTAVAKAGGKPSLAIAVLFPQLLVSSVMLGIGSALVWLTTLVFALRKGTGCRSATVAANSIFPVVMALSCVRGQAVQGVRYFLWAIFFSTIWNLQTLATMPPVSEPAASQRFDRTVVVALSVILLCLLPVDIVYGSRTMLGRSHTFDAMRADGLDRMKDQSLFADDIGFVSYFTEANVCDLNGLVNGRSFAKLTQQERIRACLNRRPAAMFLTATRLGMLPAYVSSFDTDWVACERIDFPNVKTRDTHYLLALRNLAPQICPHSSWVNLESIYTLSPR